MWRALVGAAALAGAAPAAHAFETFISGKSFAHDCSVAAFHGEVSQRYDEICTIALEKEFLNTRDLASTYVNRGILKLRRLEYANAREDFDRAIALRPQTGAAFVNRGAAMVGLHRYAEALQDIDRGISLSTEELEKAYYNRALANEGLDDLKAAYFDYLKAVEIKPDWDPPKQQLARFTVTTR